MPRRKSEARKPYRPQRIKAAATKVALVKPRAIDREHYPTGWIVAVAEWREVRA